MLNEHAALKQDLECATSAADNYLGLLGQSEVENAALKRKIDLAIERIRAEGDPDIGKPWLVEHVLGILTAEEQDISRERELLREEQTETVMPMIGSLLDRWEDLPNDVKSDPELSALKKAIENILTAMEGGHE